MEEDDLSIIKRGLFIGAMAVAGMLLFGFFIPLRGGICGPYNNPIGMNGGLQTAIWLSSPPLFFAGLFGKRRLLVASIGAAFALIAASVLS